MAIHVLFGWLRVVTHHRWAGSGPQLPRTSSAAVWRVRAGRLPNGVPPFGHADFGQADEVDELAETGQAAERGGRGARLSDLLEYVPHGGGCREQRADGEDDDAVAKFLQAGEADRRGLAAFGPVEKQRDSREGARSLRDLVLAGQCLDEQGVRACRQVQPGTRDSSLE